MSPYVRTVRTASGATAVQIVHSNRRGAKDIEHLGSAHDEVELAELKAVARQRLEGAQEVLDLGLGLRETAAVGGPLPITSSRMGHLLDALGHAYRVLGFEAATGGDEVFRDLVIARVIEATSKLDSLRVLTEAGADACSYATVKRHLPTYATDTFRGRLAAACAKHTDLGPKTLVLYDVSTLYFETDTGDGFREPGFSKERRLEPQITIGLLTNAAGFPLTVKAFEGNKAETTTMVPVLTEFMTTHRLNDVTVVADAGMFSAANQQAIEDAGLSFILGGRLPDLPPVVAAWRNTHPGQQIPDGTVFTQPWPAGPRDKRRDQVIYYVYSQDRARRVLHGIDQAVAKAEKAIATNTGLKGNRFIQVTGGTRSINRDLEAKARSLAGLKTYVTNLTHTPDGTPITAQFVIDAYHQLYEVEKSFRMAKSDLQARPIYHHKRESINAHLTIVLAALAVSRWIEFTTGWSIRRFVRTTRRYRTIQIQAGQHTLTAADPLPDDLATALETIRNTGPVH